MKPTEHHSHDSSQRCLSLAWLPQQPQGVSAKDWHNDLHDVSDVRLHIMHGEIVPGGELRNTAIIRQGIQGTLNKFFRPIVNGRLRVIDLSVNPAQLFQSTFLHLTVFHEEVPSCFIRFWSLGLDSFHLWTQRVASDLTSSKLLQKPLEAFAGKFLVGPAPLKLIALALEKSFEVRPPSP